MINIASYSAPNKIVDALELLSSGEFAPIAGGTDLLPFLRNSEPTNLLDVKNLGLDYIKYQNGYVEIGSAVTHARLSEDVDIIRVLPLLARACSLVGSQQIRNRGTIGGNIVNASPCADSVPALLNYDSEIVLLSKGATRTAKLGDFFIGPYQTIRKPSELIHSIRCKIPRENTGFSYIKLGRRQAVNISRMTLAVNLLKDKDDIIENASVAAGSVFPTTARMKEVEDYLIGQKISARLFEEAANFAANLMISTSGVRWSTPYKKPVLMGLLIRALDEAAGNVSITGT